MKPKVYTISAHRPFLATLAAGLLDLVGADPIQLPRVTVLLPTRRAVRSLREVFLPVASGREPSRKPLLLPRMRAIGDLDADEISVFDGSDEDLTVPPPISEVRRRLLLTRLVLRWGERRDELPLLPGQAATLAASLARLLDRAATEGANFGRIAELVPEGLAAHWHVVCRLLEILPQHWPRILAEEGVLDAATRRNRLLERQAAIWRRSPPRHPVIAAGLTGGIPAVAELLSLIARLEQGAVILPGLDSSRDDAEWSAIEEDETHPQHLMAGLLRAFDLSAAEVGEWPPSSRRPILARGFEALSDLPLFAAFSRTAEANAEAAGEEALSRRVRLIAEAMRPAATTDAWRRLPAQPAATLDGMSRYDCASAQEEAVIIALLLRRKLETPGATAALITPDRELARRVAAELRRWDIDIDDSAGSPLNRTPPGIFLRLVLELAASQLAPVPLLAALKHPLASGGLAPIAFRNFARRLEMAILGPRPAPGFVGLKAALRGESVELRRFAERLETCLGPLPQLLLADAISLSRVAAAHIEAAERL
ncbi:MAG: double-strand break repair protein AddB, partial [Alphaproteobacteria bacterium]|nr:double-strand break repair protein AddB [Alphaproteobacteria bacterium]